MGLIGTVDKHDLRTCPWAWHIAV